VKKTRKPIESRRPSQGPSPQASAVEVESSEEWEAGTPEQPAGLERDSEELPVYDDETKVVLLPVNPHLVHAYWGIAARDLKEIGRVFSRLGARAQPVLRFYDITQANPDGPNSPCWFEVEISLGAGNWYVHLEGSAKTYYIDLGLRTEGGGFRRLARSNVAETPCAWPSDKGAESYLLVEGDYRLLERVGQEHRGGPRSAPMAGERLGGEAEGTEGVGASRGSLTYGGAQGREAEGPRGVGTSRSSSTYGEAQGGEANGSQGRDGSPYGLPARTLRKAGPEPSGLRLPEGFGPQAGDRSRSAPTYGALGEVERELAGLCQQRNWERAGFAPEAESTGKPQPSGKEGADLTDLSERSFRAGLSSGQKSS